MATTVTNNNIYEPEYSTQNKDRKVLRYHYHNDATVMTTTGGFFYIIDYSFLLIDLSLF